MEKSTELGSKNQYLQESSVYQRRMYKEKRGYERRIYKPDHYQRRMYNLYERHIYKSAVFYERRIYRIKEQCFYPAFQDSFYESALKEDSLP